MFWIVIIASTLLVATLGAIVVAVAAAATTDRETSGMRYYGLTSAERHLLKLRIARRGIRVRPIFDILAKLPPRLPGFVYKGVHGPSGTCDAQSFAAAERYVPRAHDIFIVTQMKCGTTWMQQLVYEMLMNGKGSLEDSHHGHLYATSPWLEARVGVTVDSAPLIGNQRARLIKTHLPVSLCPYAPEARYVYVTRDPVSCFASTVDFLAMLAGPMCPPREWLLDWYLSDRMWWQSWAVHFAGWRKRAVEQENILFIRYEDMLKDLPGATTRVAAFLGVQLTDEGCTAAIRKSGIEYMRQHEERFEMSPPTLFSAERSGTYVRHGSANRSDEATAAERNAIVGYCRNVLKDKDIAFDEFYSHVVPL